jgi:hypothetical protein
MAVGPTKNPKPLIEKGPPVRKSWESEFEVAATRDFDSSPLGDGITNDFDLQEWEW